MLKQEPIGSCFFERKAMNLENKIEYLAREVMIIHKLSLPQPILF
jgi:hypothetical protein